MKQLNVQMTDCTCERCGNGYVSTYTKENTGLDPITLKPVVCFYEHTWVSVDCEDEYSGYDFAKTIDGTLVIEIEDDKKEISLKKYRAGKQRNFEELNERYLKRYLITPTKNKEVINANR